MSDDQLQQAQDFIIQQFKLIRPQLLDAYGNVAEMIKKDTTPVTELDQQVEHRLQDALTKFDAGIGFEGEELGKSGNVNTFWLIDPIDGTESFIRGLPFARNIVTLIDRDQPILTVVYKFITDELFTASKGNGTCKNGQPIFVSDRPISRSWVELSSPLSDPEISLMLGHVRKFINGYRIIGDFTLVVEGKVDAMLVYKSGGGDWDYAPRGLLMSEGGGMIANIGSDTYNYRDHNFLAANPAVFDELMKEITLTLGLK